ncbi:MAG: acyl-CoA thioesterase [Ferruginibacter sp.]
MAKESLTIPDHFLFRVSIPVRITDINYGNHLGNDSMASLLHEARVQWLQCMGYTEMCVEGVSLIMASLQIYFKKEAFYGDLLNITLFWGEQSTAGFSLYYVIETIRSEKTCMIAKAKTDMVFFRYDLRKATAMPSAFLDKIVR